MGNFLGGSAYAMASQISKGYLSVTPIVLRRLSRSDLNQLQFELQKIMTEARSNQPSQDDTLALKARNRTISRINNALMVIKGSLSGK
jgi:hypothetical protein